MIYLSILISIIYLALIIAFIIGFKKVELIKDKNTAPKNRFSVIIPFRNEALNLPDLLLSLSVLNYPADLFEILLINDDSEDFFSDIIEEFTRENPNLNLRLINNIRKTNSPKKDAINTAINESKFEWIVTTDADCMIPKLWLLLFNQFIEDEQPLFISAPVKFREQHSFLFHFQNLNFISLMGSTLGGFGLKKPFMCNGANLCYRKDAFFKLKGFEDNTHIASGDDIFLMEKMSIAFPEKIKFLKSDEAIVKTNTENNWKLFLNQQIRWASKSTSYKSMFAKFVGLCVFLENLIVLILGISVLLFPKFWIYFMLVLTIKIIVDFILITQTSIFLKNTKSLIYYLPTSLLYPFFIVFTGCLSVLKNYEWKGRSFTK